MTNETAEAFIASTADLDHEERIERFNRLPRKERVRVLLERSNKDAYFVPENAREHRSVVTSPSGRWVVEITGYATRKGAWDYTRGEVYRVPVYPETERVKVADVKRNYSSMWTLWVEGHKVTGHDYLITGEDYQGYTVVNLTTGHMVTHVPDEAYQGHGWCPTSGELLGDGITLKLTGCYWACPYEHRLLDFSTPDAESVEEDGLPDLTRNVSLDADEHSTLEVGDDGSVTLTSFVKRHIATGEYEADVDQNERPLAERIFKAQLAKDEDALKQAQEDKATYQAKYWPNDNEYYEGWESVEDERTVYVRDPSTAALVKDPSRCWKSERMLAWERQQQEWAARQAAQFASYMDTEPLYQLIKQEFHDHRERTGRSFPSMHMRWSGDVNPFYFSVRVNEQRMGSTTARVEWGCEDGPVVVERWKRGTGTVKSTHARSAEGMREALSEARAFLAGGSIQP